MTPYRPIRYPSSPSYTLAGPPIDLIPLRDSPPSTPSPRRPSTPGLRGLLDRVVRRTPTPLTPKRTYGSVLSRSGRAEYHYANTPSSARRPNKPVSTSTAPARTSQTTLRKPIPRFEKKPEAAKSPPRKPNTTTAIASRSHLHQPLTKKQAIETEWKREAKQLQGLGARRCLDGAEYVGQINPYDMSAQDLMAMIQAAPAPCSPIRFQSRLPTPSYTVPLKGVSPPPDKPRDIQRGHTVSQYNRHTLDRPRPIPRRLERSTSLLSNTSTQIENDPTPSRVISHDLTSLSTSLSDPNDISQLDAMLAQIDIVAEEVRRMPIESPNMCSSDSLHASNRHHERQTSYTSSEIDELIRKRKTMATPPLRINKTPSLRDKARPASWHLDQQGGAATPPLSDPAGPAEHPKLRVATSPDLYKPLPSISTPKTQPTHVHFAPSPLKTQRNAPRDPSPLAPPVAGMLYPARRQARHRPLQGPPMLMRSLPPQPMRYASPSSSVPPMNARLEKLRQAERNA